MLRSLDPIRNWYPETVCLDTLHKRICFVGSTDFSAVLVQLLGQPCLVHNPRALLSSKTVLLTRMFRRIGRDSAWRSSRLRNGLVSKTSVLVRRLLKRKDVGAASGDEQSVLIAVHGVDECVIDEMKRETASAL